MIPSRLVTGRSSPGVGNPEGRCVIIGLQISGLGLKFHEQIESVFVRQTHDPSRIRKGLPMADATEPPPPGATIQESVLAAIFDSNRTQAVALALAWAAQHGYPRLFTEVLDPVLVRIGADYETGAAVSIAYGYIAAKVVEDVLAQAAPQAGAATPPAQGTVILGNIEDDYHALGRKMVGAFLRAAGWEVRDLGNDVPAGAFVDAAVESGARVIGVSAMMQTTALNIAKVRAELDRRGLSGRIQLAVGGAIFVLRPDLVEEVGGDGTARNAFVVPALMTELAARAKAAEGAG